MKEAGLILTYYLALAAVLLPAGGCQLLPSFSDDEEVVSAERRTFVRLDASGIPAPGADNTLSPLQQDVIQRQLNFLNNFVRDANEWYLPFVSSYLPSLRTAQEKRLIPVLTNSPLVTSLNQRDITVSLSAANWHDDYSAIIPLLRQELIRSAINRILTTFPVTPFPEAEQHKSDMVRRIFSQGVPVYLSSFGMLAGYSPLTFALAGERDQVEEQFRILRDETAAVSEKEKAEALTRAGLWICYKIETLSGTDTLIQAVQEGPRSLYDHYLATRPGILLSLESVPVQKSPFPDDLFITH